ncbi:MAG: toxin-antitoxin system [Acidobacteria bacterium]|nr:MAG: toxin-antitoxin system [Acidobacteriota bacterium]
MAQVIVRRLDEDVKEKLQRLARSHGRSMEEEIREILRSAVRNEGSIRTGLGSRIAARFRGIALDDQIPELRG